MDQVFQLIGAVLILAGFVGSQYGLLDPRSYRYLALNASGSAILALLALLDRQWGFFLLEGVWALVSVWGLIFKFGGREPSVADR